MKKVMIGLLAAVLLNHAPLMAADGFSLYQSMCSACHVASGRPTVAPPLFGVKNHVMGAYPERQEFVEYIVQWVKNPQAERSLMPGAVRRFGVMPTLPYSETDVRAVAGFIYDADLSMPDWYSEHYRQEHGKMPNR